MNFSVLTFGCKVNQGESEDISLQMVKAGYEFLEFSFDFLADIIIINSCTVTAESDRKLNQCIKRIGRTRKNCIVVLTGCMPQAFPQEASEIHGVDIVLGNEEKSKIVYFLDLYLKERKKILKVENIEKVKKFSVDHINPAPHRLRAFVKIEDGCNRFCSYCIIPYARGQVRSKPLKEITKDVTALCENGYKEIVLTGINLSSYGLDLGAGLYDAVKAVCGILKVQRVRLGSLEPDLMNEELMDNLSKEEKLCPQFHLSLQSGSDAVLKKMRRRYNVEEYVNIVKNIKRKFPFATFTTDIMVGFPGESEEDFKKSMDLVSKVNFLKVHVFPYSSRPGTPAANFENQVENKIKNLRVKQLIEHSNKVGGKVLNEFINSKMDVLYETADSKGFYKGHTSNYILVKTFSNTNLCGQVLSTVLKNPQDGFCLGEIL